MIQAAAKMAVKEKKLMVPLTKSVTELTRKEVSETAHQ